MSTATHDASKPIAINGAGAVDVPQRVQIGVYFIKHFGRKMKQSSASGLAN